MRLVTGDDCGLLKEVLPELCRPRTADDGSVRHTGYGSSSASAYAIHAGRARPSATSIQAAAAAASGADAGGPERRAVRRLEPGADAQGRARGVVALAFLPAETDGDADGGDGAAFRFAALRANGSVEAWSAARPSPAGYGRAEVYATAAAYRKDGPAAEVLDAEEPSADGDGAAAHTGWYARQPVRPIGMVSTHHHPTQRASAATPLLATCDSRGTVSVLRARDLAAGVVARYNAFDLGAAAAALPPPSSSGNDRGGKGTLTYTKGGFANAHVATAVALCGGGARVAVGGRERGARVLDLENGQLLWKAKNLPPDPQTLLQQPMWTTTMQYLHAPTAYTNGSDNTPQNLLATGTAYKQVQIYDIRTASTTRRPVLYTPEKLLSHRTTALCQLPDGNTLAVGDAAGDCHLLDLRHMHYGHVNANRLRKKAAEEIGLGRLVGPGGSIRQLAVHPTLPYLACVGLDRKLWTWDVTRRKMVDCVYLKQKLNCVLFCEDGSWDGMDGDGAEEEGVRDGEGEETEAAGVKRGRGLAEEDDVEDYVDSEDETEAGQSNHDTANNGAGKVGNGTKQQKESSSTSSEETTSDSSEGDGEGSDEDGDESDDGESDSSEEEDPAPSSANPTKRRRK